MTSPHRRQRGSEAQGIVAEWFRTHGWPYAESTGSGRKGTDVTGLPGLSVEVKARRDFDPLAWLRQAAKSGSLSFACWQPDGYGPAKVASWPVMMTLETLTGLLRDAGYGEKPDSRAWLESTRLAAALRDIEDGRG